MGAEAMKISIVVANHGRDLSGLHKSIENSRVKPDGLFIIDRGLERSTQRNMGISEAIAKFGLDGHAIIWLDSDQTISETLIGECKNLLKYGYSCLYIPEIIVADSYFGKVRAFERGFYTGTAVDVPRCVRAEVCPLFDEEQHGTEDADWGNQIRGHRGITVSPLYHHDDIKFLDYFKKKAYYAKSLRRFKERNPDDPVLNPWYRCIKIFTEKGKWVRLIRCPIKTICVFFIILVRGIIYYANR